MSTKPPMVDPRERAAAGEQLANRVMHEARTPRPGEPLRANDNGRFGAPRQPSPLAKASTTAPGMTAQTPGLAQQLASDVARQIMAAGGVGYDANQVPLPIPQLRAALNNLPGMDAVQRIELKNKLDRFVAGLPL